MRHKLISDHNCKYVLLLFILFNFSLSLDLNVKQKQNEITIVGIFPQNNGEEEILSLAINDTLDSNWWPNNYNINYKIIYSECQEHIGVGKFVDLYEELNEKIVSVIGPECPSVAEGVSIVGEYYEVPIISPTVSSLILSDRAQFPFFARVIPPSDSQIDGWIELCKKYNWSEIAVIYGSSSSNYEQIASTFKSEAEKEKIKVSFFEIFTILRIDLLQDKLTELEESLLGVIFLISSGNEALEVFSNLDQYNLTGQGIAWIGNEEWQIEDFWTYGDNPDQIFDFSQGSLGFRPYLGDESEYQRISKSITNQDSVSPYIGYIYDAVMAATRTLSQMIKNGNDPSDGKMFLKELQNISFQGITGIIEFNDLLERSEIVYDLVNLQANQEWKIVGQWETGSSISIASSVYFPGNTNEVPSQERISGDIVLILDGIFPFEGSWPVGLNFYAAFELALIDAQSMMPPGWKLKGYSEDSHCAAGNGITSTVNAHNKGAIGIVGAVCSVATTPASQLAGAWEIPVVSPASTSLSLSDKEKYPFFRRVISPDSVQAYNWIDFCLRYKWKRVAVLYSQEDIHTQTALLFINEATKNGIEVEAQSFQTGGPYDFQLQAVISKRNSIIILSSYGDPDATQLLVRANELGLIGPNYAWLGSDSWIYDDFWMTYPEPEKVIVAAQGATTISPSPGYEPQLTRMKKYLNDTYGLTDPPLRVAYTYDATLVYVEAFKTLIEAGEDPRKNGTRLLEVIQNTRVSSNITITGEVYFNPTGDRDQVFMVMSFKDGILTAVNDWSREFGFNNDTDPLWIGGYTPKDTIPQQTFDRDENVLNAFLAVTIILIVWEMCIGLFWIQFRAHRTVKISSHFFSSLMLFGVLLYYLSVFVAYASVSDGTCIGNLWMNKIAYCLVFGCLYIKTYRLWKVFDNKSLKTLNLPDSVLMRYLSVILAISMSYLIAWTVIDPYEQSYKTDPSDDTIRWKICESDDSEWSLVYVIIELVFLFWGVFLAYKIRNIPLEANEAVMLGYSIYNMFLIKLVILAILETTDPDPTSIFILTAFESLYAGTTVLAFNFVPRIYFVFFSPNSSSFKTPSGPSSSR